MTEQTTLEEWIEDNKKLIYYIAKRNPHYLFSIHDRAQMAWKAVVKAWKYYDEDKGHFLPYVIAYIDNEIKKVYQDRYQCQLSLDYEDDSGLKLISQAGETPKDDAERHEVIERLYEAIGKLDNRKRDFICRYYGLDTSPMTYEELGDMIDVTKQRAKQIVDDAEYEIKKYLEKYEIESVNFYDFEDVSDLRERAWW